MSFTYNRFLNEMIYHGFKLKTYYPIQNNKQ